MKGCHPKPIDEVSHIFKDGFLTHKKNQGIIGMSYPNLSDSSKWILALDSGF